MADLIIIAYPDGTGGATYGFVRYDEEFGVYRPSSASLRDGANHTLAEHYRLKNGGNTGFDKTVNNDKPDPGILYKDNRFFVILPGVTSQGLHYLSAGTDSMQGYATLAEAQASPKYRGISSQAPA